MTRNTRPAPRTVSDLSLSADRYASSQYAADAGVPGMRNSAPGTSPANIAIAVDVTMAATAGIGGRKNVTGTSSADRHRGGQSGDRSDEQAKQGRRHDDSQHERIEDLPEAQNDVLYHATASSTPHGRGTRSRL